MWLIEEKCAWPRYRNTFSVGAWKEKEDKKISARDLCQVCADAASIYSNLTFNWWNYKKIKNFNVYWLESFGWFAVLILTAKEKFF